ncbi:MAG: AAA family ATPase, partial [Desulfobacterales bacterium]
MLWISGDHRVGKTCLCQTIAEIHYFDCELPRVRRMMEDSEGFLSGLRHQRVVMDEIHRLGNPSEILKIAADHYPDFKIIAKGSSRLGEIWGTF